MSKLDDVVCNGIGLVSSGLAAIAVNTAVKSIENNNSVSRIVLDVLAASAAFGIASIASYMIRDKIFYETRMINLPSEDVGKLDHNDYFYVTIDKRTGEELHRFSINGYGEEKYSLQKNL